jgi:alkylation response protein AidB-like acyl-CoA dehydrogenase
MSYFFSEEHQLFRQSLRDFLERDIRPHVDSFEEQGFVPRWVYEKFGEMGYFGLNMPEAYGGLGLDFWYTIVFYEEMCRMNSGGLGAALGAHAFLALVHLEAQATDEQKKYYLAAGIAGEKIGCLAITEPFGGSDVAAIRTKAELDGDHYIISGSKTFITNGVNSDFLILAARTSTEEKSSAGISMFIVDRDSPGLSATNLKKLGWHASDTGEIALDSVRVPKENLLGQEGHGFYYIMQHFVLERLGMASSAVATSDYALELCLQYMSEREAFGRKINRFQELRHRIAQMASEIERSRYFVYHVAQRHQQGDFLVKEASMAKLITTQLADKVATECLQMFGGYGFMEEYPMARMFRDNRLGQIGGGTSEIMKEIIARMLIDEKQYEKAI